MCAQCGEWIHDGCEKGDHKISKKNNMQKCEGNIGEAVEQGEKSCDVVDTVWEFTYHGDSVSAGGGCEAAVTVRTRFPLKQKATVYKSFVRPAILHGN